MRPPHLLPIPLKVQEHAHWNLVAMVRHVNLNENHHPATSQPSTTTHQKPVSGPPALHQPPSSVGLLHPSAVSGARRAGL